MLTSISFIISLGKFTSNVLKAGTGVVGCMFTMDVDSMLSCRSWAREAVAAGVTLTPPWMGPRDC